MTLFVQALLLELAALATMIEHATCIKVPKCLQNEQNPCLAFLSWSSIQLNCRIREIINVNTVLRHPHPNKKSSPTYMLKEQVF